MTPIHITSVDRAGRTVLQDIANRSGLGADIEGELGRDWARCFVARLQPNDEPIGFGIGWLVADEVHVIHLATAPEARRRGAGRALMNALVTLGREHACRLLLLEVRRSNVAAIALYRSVGFRVVGIRRGYYGNDGEDAIEMMLSLDPTTGDVRRGPDEVQLGGSP